MPGQELTKWFQEIRDRMRGASPPPPDPPLLRELWQVHEQLHCLENQLNNVDQDMVEYIIFRINAAERLFTALWQIARQEKLTVWDELPNPVCQVVDC